jgi:hypothetical protein
MDQQALWIIAVIGAGTLFGTFVKMKGGFGPINLRVIGIVLIAVLASLLAIAKNDNLTAAMGLLGAIAGYLFGTKEKDKGASDSFAGVDASGARISGNSRIAGRDINETVNNIEKMLGDMQSVSNATIQSLQLLSQEKDGPSIVQKQTERFRWESEDPAFVAQLRSLARSGVENWTQTWIDRCLREPGCIAAIREVILRREGSGWKPKEIGFDNHGDGVHINLEFEREFRPTLAG